MREILQQVLRVAGLMVFAACQSPSWAADCSREWEATRRDACEKYNDESHWNDSQSNRMIQQYNTRQQLEQLRQERLREQQAEQEEARRREAAKRAAEEEERQRPAREAAATREWLRELDRQDENRRFFEALNRKHAANLAAIRSRVKERVRTEVDRLFSPGAPPPSADDYDRLVTLSIPEWDLMRYWADEGLKRFPAEFAYRHAVVQTIGCADLSYAEHKLDSSPACVPLHKGKSLELLARSGQHSPFLLEQAMACGYAYLQWRQIRLTRRGKNGDTLEGPGPYRAWDAAYLATVEQEAGRLWRDAHACDAALGLPARTLHDTLMAWMARPDREDDYRLAGPPSHWWAFKRWYLVSRTVWGPNPPVRDAAAVEHVLRQVERVYKQNEPEWVYL